MKIEDIKGFSRRVINIFNPTEVHFQPTRITTELMVSSKQSHIIEKLNNELSNLESLVCEIEENFEDTGITWENICFISYHIQKIKCLQIDWIETTFKVR